MYVDSSVYVRIKWGASEQFRIDSGVRQVNVASGRRVAGAIRSLVNDRELQLECAILLHETLLVLVLCMAVRHCYGTRRRDLE